MKTVEEIYREMLACFGDRTGLEPREGCDLSARLYALAAQVCALYIQADWVVRQAFPQTAEGEYLDRHAQLRGLERKRPVAAEGTVRFTAGEASPAPREIPKGTVCMTAGLIRFETTRAALLEAEALTVDVPVRALEPGAAGNISAGAITSMAVAPIGVSQCTNPQPFAGGADGEEDETLRERVLDTFRRLPNGANAAFYQQGALSFDQVAAAVVIPRPRGVGSVDVVPATLEGIPGEELLQQLQDYFDARREIAVDLVVRAPETRPVDVSILVEPEEGRDSAQVLERVRQAVRGWFTGKLLGQSVLLARLGSLIYGCEGVANYVITAPAADVQGDREVLPLLGTLTVEERA
ncbi:baseplate J/gp47 family protein [Colidextribacter sp. OB.20]|uniref:baseplate J/gp47 family protein n=1 Tax=Colidextribacter sp. OB.20 TaxID=2304568 RepID=UPI00136C8BD9|nr:baseplate J/gp47 family protein [Colidextribacter sp. OB.20]NBI10888.1 baseplate J/gp47 family protein [Colidextribacter sp. OB.20]